ncbi:Gustatory receptor 11, partial [Halyomorpha halys]
AWSQPATQKEISSNSFYKEVRPLLLILRTFGRFPYRMTKEGILPFSLWSIPAIYSLSLYVCVFYFSIHTLEIMIQESYWKSKNYYEQLLIFVMISFLSHNFVLPITFWLPAPRVVAFIESWSRFESQFRQEFKKLQFPRVVKYLSIISVPAAWMHILFVVWMHFEMNVCLTLVFYPLVISSYMNMVLWFVSLDELRLQARALRRSILRLSLFLLTMYVGQPNLTFSGFTVVNRGLIKTVRHLICVSPFKYFDLLACSDTIQEL